MLEVSFIQSHNGDISFFSLDYYILDCLLLIIKRDVGELSRSWRKSNVFSITSEE